MVTRKPAGYGIDAAGNTTYTDGAGNTTIVVYKDLGKQEKMVTEQKKQETGKKLSDAIQLLLQKNAADTTLTPSQRADKAKTIVEMTRFSEGSRIGGYIRKNLGATFGPIGRKIIRFGHPR